MSDTDDNLMFDRLADDELSPQERQQLLGSLDDLPDGWRRCALALLEAQTWRREFRSLTTESPNRPPAVVQVAAATSMPLPARPDSSTHTHWLALAASVMVAFGLGWGFHARQGTWDVTNQLATSGTEGVVAEPQAGDSRDAVTLVVQDTQGRRQRVRLPLIDAASLGGQWGQTSPAVPAQVLAGLQSKGYDLRNQRRYAPLFFEQNRKLVPMVVPVDDTYVVPVSRPVY
jgi:hypothetical protein